MGPFDRERNSRSVSPSVADENTVGSGLGVLLAGPGPSVNEYAVSDARSGRDVTDESLASSVGARPNPGLLGGDGLRLGYGLEDNVMLSSRGPPSEKLCVCQQSIWDAGSPWPFSSTVWFIYTTDARRQVRVWGNGATRQVSLCLFLQK